MSSYLEVKKFRIWKSCHQS